MSKSRSKTAFQSSEKLSREADKILKGKLPKPTEDIMDKGIDVRGGLSIEIQKKLNQAVSTVPEQAEFHGETGSTMGGVGYSPLFRTVHFVPLKGSMFSRGSLKGVYAMAGEGR